MNSVVVSAEDPSAETVLQVMTGRADRGMKVAILGTRGIPGNYGGFETFAEELSTRLTARGHDVTVYCRRTASAAPRRKFRGVNLVYLPALRTKYTETFSHTYLSALHASLRHFDIVYVCNSANSPICLIPWLRGQTVVLNVDGLEWERQKWGPVAKSYYRFAARLAARLPVQVVTDAAVIQDYYHHQLRRSTRCFAYGTDLFPRGYLAERLRSMGLRPNGYVLYVSRMEPENNAMLVVEAYRWVRSDLPLVMTGDAPYAAEYIRRVRELADPRVRFLGFRFGEDYHALQANAHIYVQATEVGGTHPALVEAMGHRNAVLAHDVPEHREVLGDAGRYFAFRDEGDLACQIQALLAAPDDVEALRAKAAARTQALYSWDAIAAEYEQYFADLIARR